MAVVERTREAPAAAPALRRWAGVVVAALAMVATLPGRTHGLGLVTEPLLDDLRLDRVAFAALNLWATLLGALLCLPCGWLTDRLGPRPVLLGVTLGLGGAVVGMTHVEAGPALLPLLFVLVLLTRGLGQSALSVVSLALMGKSLGRRAGFGVGVYSFVVAAGFMGAFAAVRQVTQAYDPGWRELWGGIGLAVLAFGPVAFLAARSPDAAAPDGGPARPKVDGRTLVAAMRTPAFWVFGLATSLYGLVAAGVSLFNESILAERGFSRDVFLSVTVVAPLIGLAGNLATGWLAARQPLGRLLAAALVLMAAALVAFPLVRTLGQVYLYAVAMGLAGGMVTVIFFGVWGRAFGTAHLGQIQGAAQMLTVLASAAGPLLLAAGQRWTGSYVVPFRWAAAAAVLLAGCAWLVPLPKTEDAP